MAQAATTETWAPTRSAAGSHNPWLIAVVISIATFMEVLDTSIANVSLNHIAGSLAVTYDQASWCVTSYLVANAVVVPISGWLSEVIGRKRYYMLSVALFTAASLACGLADNMGLLILARILQGIGGGGLAPSEQSMLADSFPPQKRGLAFSLYGVTVVVGPAVGPILGGWITDHLTWNWIFFINIPIGVLSLVLVWLLVRDPPAIVEERRERLARGMRFDGIGFILTVLGLGLLEVGLDRGAAEDWFASPMICVFLGTAVVALLGMLAWEIRRPDPIVNVRLLTRRNFLAANILLMGAGAFMYGGMQCISQFLQQIMSYTATMAGFALAAGAVAALVTTALAGELPTVVQPRVLIAFGLAVEAYAMWRLTHMSTQMSFEAVAWMRVWQAAALPFIIVPLLLVSFVGIPGTQTEEASALVNMFRNLGGTIGISSVETILSGRSQAHHARLEERYALLKAPFHTAMSQAHQLGGGDPLRGLAGLELMLRQQAGMLAYIDVYWVLMVLSLALLPLCLFLKKTPKGATIQAI